MTPQSSHVLKLPWMAIVAVAEAFGRAPAKAAVETAAGCAAGSSPEPLGVGDAEARLVAARSMELARARCRALV